MQTNKQKEHRRIKVVFSIFSKFQVLIDDFGAKEIENVHYTKVTPYGIRVINLMYLKKVKIF